MDSRRLTNALLLVIAVTLVAHLMLSLASYPVIAETFQLDNCITSRPSERPTSYLHVVTHGMADIKQP